MSGIVTPVDHARVLDRLDEADRRLEDLLHGLDAELFDWRPEDGIASPREHLWRIAESARALLQRLNGRGAPAANYAAGEIPVAEIRSLLASCHRNLLVRLDLDDDEELDLDELAAIEDHLERRAHHTGAIAVLLQLIDPTRPSSLEF